jgi:hypothetical protein
VDTFEQFETAVEAALRTNTPWLRRRRSEAMAQETWEKKVALVGQRVMAVAAEKFQ